MKDDDSKRSLFDNLPDPRKLDNSDSSDETENHLQEVEKLLAKIEKNTRGLSKTIQGKALTTSPQMPAGKAGPQAPTHKLARGASPTPAQRPQPSTDTAKKDKDKKVIVVQNVAIEAKKVATKGHEKAQKVAVTKSDIQAIAARQAKSSQRVQQKSVNDFSKAFGNEFKAAFSKLNAIIGAQTRQGSIGDMAGAALAGPFWTAFKELKETVVETSENSGISLQKFLKKTSPEKTEDRRGKKRDRPGRFISANSQSKKNEELAENSFALQQSEADKDKKRHDELLRTIRSNKQTKVIFDKDGLLDRYRRGRKGRRAGAPDIDIDVDRNRNGSIPGKADKNAHANKAKPGGRLRRGAKLAGLAALLGGGALFASKSDALDTASAAVDATQAATQAQKTATAKNTTEAVEAKAVRGGAELAPKAAEAAVVKGGSELAPKAVAKGATSIGAKGAAAAAKAIPVAGQILAAGMAVYDGLQGWNDAEMHQEAFDLKEGEEASTGQKASAAAANVLDMGGLLTGAANLLGFDVNTADIAKGIYEVGDTVSEAIASPVETISDAALSLWGGIKSLFGGDSEKEKQEKDKDQGAAKAEEASKEKSVADVAMPIAASTPLAGGALAGGAALSQSGQQVAATQTAPATVSKTAIAGTLGIAGGAAALATTMAAKNQDENDNPATPAIADPKTTGLFESLTGAISELTEKIDEQLKNAKEALTSENGGLLGGMFGALGGSISGAITSAISGFGGGGGYSGGGGRSASRGSSGGGGSSFAYNPDSKIGDTIAKYESGDGGFNTIGYDRTGGTSYGKWQLASKTGSYKEWLDLLESKGGKHAEIAAQLKAAGPANTGSRQGNHVEVYKKLAAENAQLFEDTQRESLLKNNYNPAMKRLKSDSLRQMIQGDKSLQEMMFSTSVQHGGAGAGNIFNKVYKEGMNREQLIDAVYAERGGHFGSSTAQVQASVKNRFNRERDLIMGMNEGEARVKSGQATANNATRALKYDGISEGVRLKEDGKTVDLSTVKGIESLKLQDRVNIDKMHPEVVARMASAASDYERLTGQKLEISEGYRDYEEQVRTKRKHGNNAATPGKSTHGMGNTFDVAKSKIVDVENRLRAAGVDPVQFFKDHGLTRTAYRPSASRQNDESWHFEAADLRTAEMQRDRDRLQSGKKTGAEYLTAEQKAKYMAPKESPQTAIAENNTQQLSTAVPEATRQITGQNVAVTQAPPVQVTQAEAELQKPAVQQEPVAQAQANTAEKLSPLEQARAEAEAATKAFQNRGYDEEKTREMLAYRRRGSREGLDFRDPEQLWGDEGEDAEDKAAFYKMKEAKEKVARLEAQQTEAQQTEAQPTQVAQAAPANKALEDARAKAVEAEKEFNESGYSESEIAKIKESGQRRRNSRYFDPAGDYEEEAVDKYDKMKAAQAEVKRLEAEQQQPAQVAQARQAAETKPRQEQIAERSEEGLDKESIEKHTQAEAAYVANKQAGNGGVEAGQALNHANETASSNNPLVQSSFGQYAQIAQNIAQNPMPQLQEVVQQAMPQVMGNIPAPALMPQIQMPASPSFNTKTMEKLLAQLVDVTKQKNNEADKDTGNKNVPDVKMEFDDMYCAQFAHDMA